MKVLYCGVYRDGTGWGQAATDYILSLDAAGVDVVPRPLKLNDAKHEPPKRLLELEAKSAKGCDVVIQHVLPQMMDYDGRLFNIGLYASETSEFSASAWAERLNQMDKVWVINQQMVAAARKSGVTVPIQVIPHATDVTRFERRYEPLPQFNQYKDDFKFYCIGEFVRRKNFAALVKAFHLEFDPSEPVQLVLKVSRPGMGPDDLRKHVEGFCTEIKKGLKFYGGHLEAYKQEIILPNRLTDEEIMRLHASCNCFVLPSYGEAWAIPAFDAMGMGKTPIVTGATGFLDYISDKEGWLVNCHQEPVFGVNDSFQDLYVGNESWASADIIHLRKCMREAYAAESIRTDKAANGVQRIYDFSHEAVGLQMKKALLQHEERRKDNPLARPARAA